MTKKSKATLPFMGTKNPRDARKSDITIIRRQHVAALFEQDLTLHEVWKRLKDPESDVYCINPETDKPWAKSTIANDQNALLEKSKVQMLIETRRNRVKRLRLRGFTMIEIHTAMSTPYTGGGKLNPNYLKNPETGNPFSLKTIQTDIEFVRQDSQDKASQSIDTIRARLLAEIQEVKAQAWATGKLSIVLKAIVDESKLMGALMPETATVNLKIEDKTAKQNLRDKIGVLTSKALSTEGQADASASSATDNSDTAP